MQKLPALALVLSLGVSLTGCGTSCGEREKPVLWADGIVTESAGVKTTYLTTPVDGTWLHFPSYRSFRLPHGFGTKNIGVSAWVAFDEQPVSKGTKSAPEEFAVASGNVFIVTEVTNDEIVVENGTCENGYYMLAKLTNLDSN